MTPRTDSDRKMKKTCSNCVSRFICEELEKLGIRYLEEMEE